jgi:hypothetical protein
MDIFYTEKFIEERIDMAKKLALSVKTATDVQTIEQAELVLRMVISNHYKIPFFSEYFDNRTMDEMFFEAELIALQSKPQEETTSRIIKNSKAEIENIADEMEKEFEEEWKEANLDTPLDPTKADDPFLQMAKTFMQTGNFAGEGGNVPRPAVKPTIAPETKEETPDDWK